MFRYLISSEFDQYPKTRKLHPCPPQFEADSDPQWIKETHSVFAARADLPVLLLGLKRDLRSETDPNGVIYPQEAYRIAQEIRCDKYMECSAVTGELVHEAFEDICKTAVLTTTAEGGLSSGGCVAM
jgi:Ras family protein A